jgi:hypothetical protein
LNRTPAVLALSAICGALLWFLSPLLTHKVEPWDAGILPYVSFQFGIGFILGKFFKPPLWQVPAGLVAGQAAYLLFFLEKGSLLPLGLIVLGFFSLSALFGVLIAGYFTPRNSR